MTCLWITNAPAKTIFSKTVTLTDDLDFGTKERVLLKGLYMIYESSITYHSKAIANVRVFTDKQNGQMDKRISQKLYAPDLSMLGHKKYSNKKVNTSNHNFLLFPQFFLPH